MAGDKLFSYVEELQAETGRPFGSILDSGTGSHSLRSIRSLVGRGKTSEWCAITADEQMRKKTQTEVDTWDLKGGRIVVGNWAEGYNSKTNSFNDSNLTTLPIAPQPSTVIVNATPPVPPSKKFDTILADYLVGAMDGFSPYYQDLIFPRLQNHLNENGRIYVVGLQPIPDSVEGSRNVFCKVTKIRDACIHLAGHRCYREYPFEWVERHLNNSGLTLISTRKFPIVYTHNTIVRQINVARSKLSLFPNKALANAMRATLDDLEKDSERACKEAGGSFKLGFDYVITAEKVLPKKMTTSSTATATATATATSTATATTE